MAGIDPPEISGKKKGSWQPYIKQSKEYLTDFVLNEVVEIKGYGLDQYNRLWGVVYLNGKNINLEMIKAGLAKVFRSKTPKGFDLTPYLKAETEARDANKGMWGLGDERSLKE